MIAVVVGENLLFRFFGDHCAIINRYFLSPFVLCWLADWLAGCWCFL